MIVVVEPATARREQLVEAASVAGDPHGVASLEQIDPSLEPSPTGTRLVVLGPGIERREALTFAQAVRHAADGTAALLVVDDLDAALMRDALRSGVVDVLTASAPSEEWLEAITRARGRVSIDRAGRGSGAEGQATRRGRIVSVFSTKGGTGTSMLATNLAILAAKHDDQRVALVDLDLQAGDLGVMLQLVPALSIYDAAQAADRLDVDAIESYLTPHPSGVSLLAAPAEPALADQVPPRAIARILTLLSELCTLVVVDMQSIFSNQMLAVLDVTDHVVLVGSMDVPSIKNLRQTMNTMAQLGHPREQASIVLNRADSKVGLRFAEVERSLGTTIDVRLPSTKDVPVSINQGAPLATGSRRSQLVTAIDRLTRHLLPETQDDGRPRRRRAAR